MLVLETIEDTQAACRALRRAGRSIGLVPTMGALHQGHLSLVRAAKATCDATVVSIFVNPAQFAPNEDLANYPRTFDADRAFLEREGVDLVFAPTVAEMYPPGASTWVEVADLGNRGEGASRPGHFRGVATVVCKLFHIVGPSHAFFGQKDAAQLAVLRKMVADLDFDLKIVGCPTVREADGLAMSSRNKYLSADERRQALVIGRALRIALNLAASGETSAAELIAAMRSVMALDPDVKTDYISVANPATLEEIQDVRDGGLLAIAAVVGTTRLIDNVLIDPSSDDAKAGINVSEQDLSAARR
jgi:pantoate--beta-alanine ligase